MEDLTAAPGTLTVFYDEGCGVCAWIALRALRVARSGSVRVAAIGSPEGDARLGHLGEEDRWASWHVVSDSGQVRSGGAALPPLLACVPYARALVWLSELSPRARDSLYRALARTRSLWGRLVPRRSVARARRELCLVMNDVQTERGAQCSSIR